MNGKRWLFVCAAVVLCEAVACFPAYAQFGGGKAAPKSGPRAEQPPGEKSLLTAAANQGKTEAATTSFCQCVNDNPAAAARIEKVLAGPLTSAGLDYSDTPLKDVVEQLQNDYGIPIQLDKKALEEAGIGTDAPVTVDLRNISLGSALSLLFKNLELKFLIEDEVLLVTTNEAAKATLKTCVYDVRSITGDRDTKATVSLIDTIESCIAVDTWSHNGKTKGTADIRAVRPGLLVITQTHAVHEYIRGLLSTIGQMSNVRPPAAAAATPRGEDLDDKVVTRSYMLQLNPTKDIDTMRAQVHDLITQSLPDESWSGQLADGQAVTLTVFHDRVVVRQKPAVQEKLQKILADSGVATPSMAYPTVNAPTFAPGGLGAAGPEGGPGAPGVASPGPTPQVSGPEGIAPGAAPAAAFPGPNPFD